MSALSPNYLEKSPTARYEDMEALERALLALVLPDSWTDDDARTWWTVLQPEHEAGRMADVAESLVSRPAPPS